jgi:hypothetical protein
VTKAEAVESSPLQHLPISNRVCAKSKSDPRCAMRRSPFASPSWFHSR